MSQSTKEETKDISNIHTNVKENHKESYSNNELRKIEEVEDTPFHAVWDSGKGWYLVMGDYRLSEGTYETKEELIEDELRTKMWHTIGKYLFAVQDFKEKVYPILKQEIKDKEDRLKWKEMEDEEGK